MKEKAQVIIDIIGDYENNVINVDHVLDWVSQFNLENQEFILDELAVIFSKTYYSKEKCKIVLSKYLIFLSQYYKYNDVPNFLKETIFLKLQDEHKSQSELLTLVEEIITSEYQMTFKDCGIYSRHYVYLDDVLATGNTTFRQLSAWLKLKNEQQSELTNFGYLKANRVKLDVCFLCLHQWGVHNVVYRLKVNVDDETSKHITFFREYDVQNNLKSPTPNLNLMLPVETLSQDEMVSGYLNSLEKATANADRAYRKPNQPVTEVLFSSAENRNRLESIFLKKGIEILGTVQHLNAPIRPLGYTVSSHKTFGIGTLFFTYRNIPNNSPIVFWWGSNGWRPLFQLKNRGNNL